MTLLCVLTRLTMLAMYKSLNFVDLSVDGCEQSLHLLPLSDYLLTGHASPVQISSWRWAS
jgi:hypothetical protein